MVRKKPKHHVKKKGSITMATYEDMAPIISGAGIAQNAVVTYFENIPEAPAPTPDPEITSQKIVALANIRFEAAGIEKRNGLVNVAREVGLTVAQCKSIPAEIDTLFGAWSASLG